MKQIIFKTLSIQNFLSVGLEPVIINFQKGLGIITGQNKDKVDRCNGAGKSSVLDAFSFVLFGFPIRNIKKEFIKNNYTNGKVNVELEFDVIVHEKTNSYKVIRNLNKLQFFENSIDKERDSKSNTQSEIEKIINLNHDVFQNIIVLSINSNIPFMSKKKADKKLFIENIFNLGVFTEMSANLKEEYTKQRRDCDLEISKYIEIENNVKTLQQHKQNQEKDRKERTERLEKAQKENNLIIQECNKIINDYVPLDLVKYTDDKKKIEDDIEKINKALKTINYNSATKNSELKLLTKNINRAGTSDDKCPICFSSIQESDRKRIEEEKQKMIQDQLEIDQQVKKLEEQKKKIEAAQMILYKKQLTHNQLQADYKAKEANINHTTLRLNTSTKRNKELEEELSTFNNHISSNDQILEDAQKRLDACISKRDEIKKQIQILEAVKYVVSEEGIKAFIVKRIIDLLNSRISYYLKKLDGNCNLTFNEFFDETILNNKGVECVYDSFSGAEKKVIDFACMFAFMDLRRLQGDIHYNLSIYDELLDSSLDEKGVDLVLEEFNDRIKVHSEAIYIISHRKEAAKKFTGDSVFLEKKNDITRRIAIDPISD